MAIKRQNFHKINIYNEIEDDNFLRWISSYIRMDRLINENTCQQIEVTSIAYILALGNDVCGASLTCIDSKKFIP